MIKRILIAIVALFVVAFIVTWVLGGGFQDIKAGVNHYRDPLKYGSVIDWFFQIGTTTGESFHLPGTPSTYPIVSMPTSTMATTSVGPTIIYETGSDQGQGY
jgi:hypothetical protein